VTVGFTHYVRAAGKFDRCPKAWLRDEGAAAQLAIDDFHFWRKYGVLPRAGGRLDQHPKFLEAVEIIEEEILAAKGRAAAVDRAKAKLKIATD
jgi:hypothetical protein